MTTGLIHHLALVSESQRVSCDEITVVGAALQKQVTRDFCLSWGVQATVNPFGRLEDLPPSYWPMIVMDNIGFNAAGIHLDENGQPFSLITASKDNDIWSLTASRECLSGVPGNPNDRPAAVANS